jgi:hypothetical protein
MSTFTVHDTSGRLKEFLQCKGYQQFESLIESPTFHIQLVVSEGPVNSAFEIDSAQVKKVSYVFNAFSLPWNGLTNVNSLG